MRDTRDALIAHVGGNPSAPQRMLIEQAVWLHFHLAVMDRRTADGHQLTPHDSRTYLAWSNSLARLLKQLGLRGAAARPRSLADHLAERVA